MNLTNKAVAERNSGRPLRKRLSCVVLFNIAMVFIPFLPAKAEDMKACNNDMAKRAEIEASSLRSWEEVFKSYKNYARCDDGAIAEAYSDSIARLLSEHWDSIVTLSHLTRKHVSFKKFVIRHIDETLTSQQATSIHRNAKTNCPATAKRLCSEILRRLSDP